MLPLGAARATDYPCGMADIFDVVADPTRRELLGRLHERAEDPTTGAAEMSVGQLVAELGISQPTVSKHLKTLREHGLVQVREEGQHRYYRIDPAPLAAVAGWVAPFVGDAADDEDDEPLSGAYSAWAGTEFAERLGRAAAGTSHTVRSVVETAQERIERLRRG
jgi:ArsR family transcriptional regulator, arsenate/arsenite/antimonite-responsive transcriptional repressor